ncbi:stage V sporulation protein AD [Halothermothrix orenii]|uniref:Stage V sporulation AD protein n=1 Tax=Halothermothrix orenii (strain H 168 / OCM 544 / DSM 9562) TaxID=373903 RepID=B8CVZ4_HALOH|nr:stage V sporulation protein AD [Halothermothrix orenii]ACL69463.1 Stage V sporulation AD protein [Halothermothrix orenii H 168]
MAQKFNGQTLTFQNPPHIISHGSVVGPEEKKGPLGKNFDLTYEDAKCGEKTWEKGEKKMVSDSVNLALQKANLTTSDIDIILGGDLLNQLITANFVARDYDVPYLGLYGACSTMVQALGLGAALIDGSYADCVLGYCSSHYQTAERQYRNPLEYGVQYPPYKQWTVTGAGSYILGRVGGSTWITHATFGKVMDLGQKDANDMGGAMAPAAADTLIQHFKDLNRGPQDYDLILTGDLGRTGRKILDSLLVEKNINLGEKLQDCGAMLLTDEKKYGSGGSGCAASAVVVGSVIIPKIINADINRIIIIGTGALLSSLTVKQGESIPSVAHAVVIEKIPGGENNNG